MSRRRRQKRRIRPRRRPSPSLDLKPQTHRQISGAIQISAGVLLLLVLRENAGPVGETFAKVLAFFFGAYGVIFPFFLIASGLLHFLTKNTHFEVKRSVGLLLCFLSVLGMLHLRAPLEEIGTRIDELAGAVGFLMSVPFVLFASKAVGYTVLGTIFLVGIFIAFEPDFGTIASGLRSLKHREDTSVRTTRRTLPTGDLLEAGAHSVAPSDEEEAEEEDSDEEEDPELHIVQPVFAKEGVGKALTKAALKALEKKTPTKSKALEMTDTRFEEWTFPTYDLLDAQTSELKVDDEELKRQAKLIEEKLSEFEIDVAIREARPGPTVTQFTLKPAEGVKLSKIASLKDDLAMALAAKSLRIEAPIPGKDLVGIEMPNLERTIVHLREILESPQFVQSESSLALPLGRDVSGEAVVVKLNDMPHLLIAGATGSGKSVCMNTFLLSLLFQNAPHELKFILIDPKYVELKLYDGIPHLLTPVITESEKALQALRWVVAEMGRRLHRFSEGGVRNIDEFNSKQTEEGNLLYRVVIVIDELADLMMRQYRRDTELMVTRIAQMARATGMHMLLATQRPSVDVITGLIKANIPVRIAFRTVSAVDSRTIIDGIGAEDLLGRGDMLYMSADHPNPIRIQGIFVSTKEVERVIHAVKIAGGGELTEEIPLIQEDEEEDRGGVAEEYGDEQAPTPAYIDLEQDDDGGDSLFFEAVNVVRETGKASASLLQRRLSVGYARAAKLLDIMERKGLIGPVQGAKAREVYMEKAPTV